METSIDLYSEEYAGDYVDLDDENADNENQEEQLENEIQEEPLEADNNDNEAGENKEDEEKKKVKPKRVIRNPRPKLDLEALKSHKGLLCLENYFKNKKYKERGHEEDNLRTIMKTYEHWCHRLFPKFPFDECLEKLEKLGAKKNSQNYLKRIRMDLIFEDEQTVRNDNENDNLEESNTSNTFDNLLPEQHDDQMPILNEEQLERIRINREKANQVRIERLQRAKEKAQTSLTQDIPVESIQGDLIDNVNSNLQDQDIFIGNNVLQEKSNDSPVIVPDLDEESRKTITPEIEEASNTEDTLIT